MAKTPGTPQKLGWWMKKKSSTRWCFLMPKPSNKWYNKASRPSRTGHTEGLANTWIRGTYMDIIPSPSTESPSDNSPAFCEFTPTAPYRRRLGRHPIQYEPKKQYCPRCESLRAPKYFRSESSVYCLRHEQEPPQCLICNRYNYRKGKYCSDECYSEAKKRKYWREKKVRIAECKICGQSFETMVANRIYCSDECRKKRIGNTSCTSVGQWRIFKRDGFQCIYCGGSSIEDGVKLNADHIIPASKGGPTTAGNLITSCSSCNLSKTDLILDGNVISRLLSVVAERNKMSNMSPDLEIKFSMPAQEE